MTVAPDPGCNKGAYVKVSPCTPSITYNKSIVQKRINVTFPLIYQFHKIMINGLTEDLTAALTKFLHVPTAPSIRSDPSSTT